MEINIKVYKVSDENISEELRLESIEKEWEKFFGDLYEEKHIGKVENRKLTIKLREKSEKSQGEKDLAAIAYIRDLIDKLYVIKRLYSIPTPEEKIENIRRNEELGKLYTELKVDELWKNRNF